MKILNNNFIKKLIVIICLVLTLTTFWLTPISKAASSKIKMSDGEFYYAGTQKGAYVVTEGIFAWLLNAIAEIADFLLGLFTMGGRMVFVGWTALIEILMTSVLESTTGIPMDADVDSTQLENSTNSSKNVTIEAIVYNQVPIFNINLFDIDDNKISCTRGSGQFWVECDTCADPNDSTGLCRMQECTCDTCMQAMMDAGYVELDADGNYVRVGNLVSVIRNNVAMWYYILRLIAMMGMLLILIGLGIKLAISSIAEEKALYKRMLVDWLVGIILLFTMQYIMIAIINVNTTLVNVVKNIETGVTEVTMKEFNITDKSNQDIEISVYEAVRTRAYDAKLINGTSGMIMYITLVFLAIKYCFIYVKRYFTIIVLTLMSPGVAFGYAVQKVISGKETSFSNWLTEYFVTVTVQFIHALVYTIFISEALVISLNSISGIIIAFVMINFMSKAEQIYRKIFKFGKGKGELGQDVTNADPRKLAKSAKSAMGFMVAGNIMKKSPVTKAVTAPLRAAGTGLVVGASNIKSWKDKVTNADEKAAAKMEQKSDGLEEVMNDMQNIRDEMGGDADKKFAEYADMYENLEEKDQVVGLDGEDYIERELEAQERKAFELANDEDPEIAAKGKELMAQVAAQREKFDKLTNITTGDVLRAHKNQFLDKKNYKNVTVKNGKEKYKQKYRPFIGNLEYNEKTGKWTRMTMSKAVGEQMKIENLLGFSEADKKLWKESTALAKNTLLGLGSLVVGMGTVVTSPGIGMALLGNGVKAMTDFRFQTGMYGRKVQKPLYDDNNKIYKFNRFGKGAKKTIMKTAIATAEGEKNRIVVQNVKNRHPRLYQALRLGGVGVAAVGGLTFGTAFAPVAIGVGSAAALAGSFGRASGASNPNSLAGRMNAQHFKQYKQLRQEAIKDELDISAKAEKEELKAGYASLFMKMEGADLLFGSTEEQDAADEASREVGDIVQTQSGEEIRLETPQTKGELKAQNKIIQEAVAEVIIKNATSSSDGELFGSKSSIEDAKRIIEQKFKQQGKTISKEELNNLTEQIISASAAVLSEEEARRKVSTVDGDATPSDGNPSHEVKEQSVTEKKSMFSGGDSTSSGDATESKTETTLVRLQTKTKVTKLEEALIKQVIQEQVKSDPSIKSAKDIDADKIAKAVEEKKRQLFSTDATDSVADKLQAQKQDFLKTSNPVDGSRLVNPSDGSRAVNTSDGSRAVDSSKDGSVKLNTSGISDQRRKLLESLANPSQMQSAQPQMSEGSDTGGKDYSSMISNSDSLNSYISQTVGNIQTINSHPTAGPQTAEQRREDKKKRIAKLSDILEATAAGKDYEEKTPETGEVKSTDDVLKELFQNTEEYEQANGMLQNVKSMRALNRRAELMKMKSTDTKYNKAKRQEDREKDYKKYNAPEENKKEVDDTLESKATYGPLEDIVDLIKNTSSQYSGEKKNETDRTRRRKL